MTTKSGEPGITRVPEHRCLNCGAKMNLHGGTPDGKPDRPAQPGDLCMCIKCCALQMIADDLTVRAMTPAELAEIQADANLWAYLSALADRIDRTNAVAKHLNS